MPRRFRKKPIGTYRPSTKHSGTFQDNVGPNLAPAKLIILKTGGGPRSIDGSPQTIQSFSDTEEDCKVGDNVKYVNFTIQSGARNTVATPADRIGWQEWAFVCVRENETEVPSTRVGVQTLGDICTNMYRGECIFTGAIPQGDAQPTVAQIKLKIPKKKQKIKLGDEWRFVTYFRAVNSVSMDTVATRLVKSFNYIVYS